MVLAFKPLSDTRSGAAAIRTHTGIVLEARPLKAGEELVHAAGEAVPGAVVGVDEVHFFGKTLIEPVLLLRSRGVRVVLAGVDLNHRGEHFEPFPTLLKEADEVVLLKATCAVCGSPAEHSQRMVESDDHIVVGGAEAYQARCRSCFEPGR